MREKKQINCYLNVGSGRNLKKRKKSTHVNTCVRTGCPGRSCSKRESGIIEYQRISLNEEGEHGAEERWVEKWK